MPFASAVDKDTPHRFARCAEEVGAVLPVRLLTPTQPQPRFVDERGRLEGLARLLIRHPHGSKLAQLLVNQREQIFGGFGIAFLNTPEKARHVAHG